MKEEFISHHFYVNLFVLQTEEKLSCQKCHLKDRIVKRGEEPSDSLPLNTIQNSVWKLTYCWQMQLPKLASVQQTPPLYSASTSADCAIHSVLIPVVKSGYSLLILVLLTVRRKKNPGYPTENPQQYLPLIKTQWFFFLFSKTKNFVAW